MLTYSQFVEDVNEYMKDGLTLEFNGDGEESVATIVVQSDEDEVEHVLLTIDGDEVNLEIGDNEHNMEYDPRKVAKHIMTAIREDVPDDDE